MQQNTIAQDAPGTIFSRGPLLWHPPFFDHAYRRSRFSRVNVIGHFARWKTVWTLPSLWTHRTRPQVTWKTAKSAVFHSVHTDHSLFEEERGTEKSCMCANLIVSTEGFTPTERYLGCKQKLRHAVNDRLGIEPDAA
jgi:hypothetical protein